MAGTLGKLNNFIAKINKVHSSIKFDFNYSSNSVNFLDTAVNKSSAGKLPPTLFKKKTECQPYLHRKSEHQKSLKRRFPYAQALRLKGTCTKDRDFKASYDILSKKPIDRGYKKAEIYDNVSKTFDRNREDLLTQIMNLNIEFH